MIPVLVILISILVKSDARCGPCTAHEQCLDNLACLPGLGKKNYCQSCPCAEKSQCRVHENRTVYCDCSGSVQGGPSCECQPTTQPTTCPGICPPGFSQSSATCTCYSVGNDQGPFYQAARRCESMNSSLAKITSPEESTFVHNLIKGLNSYYYWLGACVKDKIFNWIVDGSNITYTNWNYENYNLFFSCMVMTTKDGTWASQAEDYHYGYVCEYIA